MRKQQSWKPSQQETNDWAREGSVIVKADPQKYGLSSALGPDTSSPPTNGDLEMLKVAFCLMMSMWMAGCITAAIYSAEIARFMVGHGSSMQ